MRGNPIRAFCTWILTFRVARSFALWLLYRVLQGFAQDGSLSIAQSGDGMSKLLYGPVLPPFGIVALQSLLGSDNRRESLNFRRASGMVSHRHGQYWKKRWNILFDRKLKP